jgi:hypothetical protein
MNWNGQRHIAEVVGSNPIVSTRNSLMDAGFFGLNHAIGK